jgi:hypothetical protein
VSPVEISHNDITGRSAKKRREAGFLQPLHGNFIKPRSTQAA